MPVALAVVFGVGHLLAAMADDLWARILYRACLIGGIVWVVDLICLLIALAVNAVDTRSDSNDKAGD
jgi:hypothetical protein